MVDIEVMWQEVSHGVTLSLLYYVYATHVSTKPLLTNTYSAPHMYTVTE